MMSIFEGNEQKSFEVLDTKLSSTYLGDILSKKLSNMGLSSKEKAIEYIDNLKDCKFDEDMMEVLNIIIIVKKMKEKLKDESRICLEYEKIKAGNVLMFEYL
jgi:hypothetical protein